MQAHLNTTKGMGSGDGPRRMRRTSTIVVILNFHEEVVQEEGTSAKGSAVATAPHSLRAVVGGLRCGYAPDGVVSDLDHVIRETALPAVVVPMFLGIESRGSHPQRAPTDIG